MNEHTNLPALLVARTMEDDIVTLVWRLSDQEYAAFDEDGFWCVVLIDDVEVFDEFRLSEEKDGGFFD